MLYNPLMELTEPSDSFSGAVFVSSACLPLEYIDYVGSSAGDMSHCI